MAAKKENMNMSLRQSREPLVAKKENVNLRQRRSYIEREKSRRAKEVISRLEKKKNINSD
jgi:hypothetical protein